MRLVILEDQALVRRMLVNMCQAHYDVVGDVENGEEALDICRAHRPDLVVLDIRIPGIDGIEVAETLMAEQLSLKVLALSGKLDQYTIFRLLKLGIHGYVDKFTDDFESVIEAIQAIERGKTYFSETYGQAKKELKRDPLAFYKIFSERELEIVPLLSQGLDDESISVLMEISPATVKWHRSKILRKLDLHDAAELMRYGLEKGFWDPRL